MSALLQNHLLVKAVLCFALAAVVLIGYTLYTRWQRKKVTKL